MGRISVFGDPATVADPEAEQVNLADQEEVAVGSQ